MIAALTRSSGLSRPVGAARAAERHRASAVPPIAGSSVRRGGEGRGRGGGRGGGGVGRSDTRLRAAAL